MQFRTVRPVVSRPPPSREAETVEAISVRQKLIVLRENLKTRVTAHPEDSTAFLQLVGVHVQLGEAGACALWARNFAASRADFSWRSAAKALHRGLGPSYAEELLMDVLSFSSTDDATRAEVCSILGQLRPHDAMQWYRKARLKHGKRPLNYAFFAVEDDTQTPRRLESLTGQSGMILAFEGGAFVWPGVRVGFRRNMTIRPANAPPIELQMETRSLQPLLVEISSFLDASDCQHIIDKALPHVEKSTVKHMDHDVGKPDANWRTSSTYFMQSDDDVLRRIDERVSALTLIRKSHQELAQILRYQRGEKYVGHTDYFDVEMYANDQQIQSMTKQGLFNRLATVFFYLTDVEEGGETNFPRTDGLPQPVDFSDCSKGISVHPTRGRIIIFYSLHLSGEADEYSLHAGCEVKQGTKWSANKWIWNKPMNYVSE